MDENIKKGNLSFWQKPLILAGAMFLLGTAVFLPTLGYDFVWDDYAQIKTNPQIKSVFSWPRLLVSKVPLPETSLFYRPLFMLSLAGDYALYKENPGGYHLTSSVLHGLNSALVTYLAGMLFHNPYGALAAGALFALHPVHPEAVSFIGARVDLLFTFFSLLSFIALLKTPKNDSRLNSLLWAPLFFLLALCSKETAMVVLIPLACWWYQKNQEESDNRRKLLPKLLPWGLVLILYFILRQAALKTLPTKILGPNLVQSPVWLLELAFRYLIFLLFPGQKAPYFYNAPSASAYSPDIRVWLMGGLILLLLALAAYMIYRRRETAPFWALIILPCLPSLYYSLHQNTISLERYLYLPTVGLALLAAWGFLQVPKDMKKWAAGGMALILMVYLGGVLWRTPVWKNEITLFEALKQEYPASPYIRACLGQAYHNQKRLWEAYQEMSIAVAQEPQEPAYHIPLGWLCLELGWAEKARGEFEQVLQRLPGYAPALQGMGLAYQQEGNYELALRYLDRAAAADPKNETIAKNRNLAAQQKEALRKKR